MSAGAGSDTRAPKVATIPPGVPFLDALVLGLRSRFGSRPDSLTDATLLLPTRRAVLSLRDAFLRQSEGRPLLLPAMLPIGDVDEDELLLEGGDRLQLELPPAIAPLRRELLLMKLVQAAHRPEGGIDAVQAAPLARELAAFLDLMQREDVPLDRLQDLVPEAYAEHWQKTLTFLQVLAEPWRGLLAAEGAIDPVERRNRLIRARAAAWQASPPAGPVIVAGTTGSVPATADLLAVVASLPQGVVVLPGLDRALDADSWAALQEDHPQFGMRELLARLGLGREAVVDWLDASGPAPRPGRARLVQEALRPSETTEQWHDMAALPADAGEGLTRVDCAGEQQEALSIALAMRQALEVPGRTAALVTPDRGLARRVATELKRWQVEVDDSAGVPLAATPPAALLRLSAEAFAEEMAPIPLLALLKHPLALAARPPGRLRRLARLLDRKVLRGPRPAPGLRPLVEALGEVAHADREALLALLDELATRGRDFAEALAAPRVDLVALLEAHVALVEWLATDADGETQVWRGEAGEALGGFLNELLDAADGLPAVETAGYPAFLSGLMAGRAVRPRYGRHPRLSIWGPLEARLQQPDLLIMGGLNEGTWPAIAEVDAWLSRPMRAHLGLSAPERRIGLAAHDFVQAAAAPEVLLTRAEKVGSSPTVPSRWLLRLERVLSRAGLSQNRAGGDWPQWAELLQDAGEPRPVDPPACRPPVAARPRRLSVTRIEMWMRDPYAIYARYILDLDALEPIAADAGAADRGNAVHEALDRFVAAHPDDLPTNARAVLERFGEEAFGPLLDRPGVRAFWWPRFLRVADWFIANEAGHRESHTVLATEVTGKLELPGPAGSFVLTAKADRIDRLADGSLTIIDYKTGVLPGGKEIERGESPQLPLEAAIASSGGFAGVPAQPVAQLAYWKLSGGRRPAEIRAVQGDPMAAAEAARDGLIRLIAEFDNPGTPYRARPRPAAAPKFSDYDHLSRVKEWSAGGPGDW